MKKISRLKNDGFVIVMADENFVRDVKKRKKYWTKVNKRIFSYTGNHESLVVLSPSQK